MRKLLPDLVLEFDEADAGSSTSQAKLTYGMRTYSAWNSVPAGSAAADRNNQFQWANTYYVENDICFNQGIYRQEDDAWVDPNSQLGSTSHPQLAAVNGIHNAFLRTLIRQRAGQLPSDSVAEDEPEASLGDLPTPPPNGTLWAFQDRPRLDVVFSQIPRVYYYPQSAASGQGQLQVSALVWPVCTMILFPLFAAAIA